MSVLHLLMSSFVARVKGEAHATGFIGPKKTFLGLYSWIALGKESGDSWMYPYQRTPMGNPYISPIYPYIVGVYGLLSPRIPIFSPYKYHGAPRTLGVHPSLSLERTIQFVGRIKDGIGHRKILQPTSTLQIMEL